MYEARFHIVFGIANYWSNGVDPSIHICKLQNVTSGG